MLLQKYSYANIFYKIAIWLRWNFSIYKHIWEKNPIFSVSEEEKVAGSEEELKSLLMRMKEESEKGDLKPSTKKN